MILQQEVSPRTSGRLSHSSGPLNGSLTDSPPLSPSELDDMKWSNVIVNMYFSPTIRFPLKIGLLNGPLQGSLIDRLLMISGNLD
ncbi:hypothetical protein CTI12_AA320910 [Artemisia annua]|uniref:VAN3-binding protein-like auxin canalisation domain-containing protein n=1 Tax=Artemisia annua TaxID=35608 RepID=A0A2U1N0W1_ARTAN|nr:hypothetical protein CTI12_AA320910 [Artemisia annua]